MKRFVFFSGAGMSAESGINTFRDTSGLWEKYSIEEVTTTEAWKRNPSKVQDFYNQRRKQIIDTAPNAAHLGIADLENLAKVTVITQNIDDLHERAGSMHVLHLHGNIRFAKSSGPNQEKKYYPIDGWELTMDQLCEDNYPLRPHVVWFGEEVPMLDEARQIIEHADVFVVIGTSLQVYPAAGLIHYTKADCIKFLIDPNAEAMTVLKDFTILNENASTGIETLKKKLSALRLV
jgi:NAD-dependent deacetylase